MILFRQFSKTFEYNSTDPRHSAVHEFQPIWKFVGSFEGAFFADLHILSNPSGVSSIAD
jgi:hypothetical protein